MYYIIKDLHFSLKLPGRVQERNFPICHGSLTKMMHDYTEAIRPFLGYALHYSSLGIGSRKQGKVRDIYDLDQYLLLVTSDRVSAFDRVLADVPLKGQVLNQISAWWFNKTKHIIPNHVLAVPDPNVVISKKCKGIKFKPKLINSLPN